MAHPLVVRTIDTLGRAACLLTVLVVVAPAFAVDGLSFVRAYRNG